MNCPYCGRSIADDYLTCPHCLARLSLEGAAAEEGDEHCIEESPAEEQPPSDTDAVPGRGLWIAGLLASSILLTLLGSCCVDLFFPRDNEGSGAVLMLFVIFSIPVQLVLGIFVVGPLSFGIAQERSRVTKRLIWSSSLILVLAISIWFSIFGLPYFF